ncbi:quinone-dependent dihydroorotate dehydrogenase [Rhodococcus rhodochrous]|uniref:quinone-dependent dihydroorotate dehydrogenase n=1 Tax=Rhodococcus rhodochrous TaxID=1829 RepID=UPI00132E73D2|nr:quinone-dependent dihydroorotate dehydrogenase [Rhodococcus rhodochrous]QHG83700.1 quinone-dependent dihydroorotate dehydrogenase [Rhodococcus rhodochrous]
MYRYLLRLMFLLPPERAHHLAFLAMRWSTRFGPLRALVAKVLVTDDPILRNTVFGVQFPTPVGLAAGFDKDRDCSDSPRTGRLFRLPEDRAIVNRMGFNNHGAGEAANRLRQRRRTVPIGANIGKTKVVPAEQAAEDYTESARLLGPLADFVVVNVSSPNTPGLRDLQAVESLRPILAAVLDTVTVPVLVKIAPDLSDEDVDAVADLALELGLAGIVATNTTIRRDGLNTPQSRVEEIGAGGLSGAPVAERSLEVLRRLRTRVGDRLTLVSVGGIETPEQAFERILAGASLVQGYTGFIYGGPFWARRINRGIARKLRAHGYRSIADAVGATARV